MTDERPSPELAARLLRAKVAELEAQVKYGDVRAKDDLWSLVADVALVAGLLVDVIDRQHVHEVWTTTHVENLIARVNVIEGDQVVEDWVNLVPSDDDPRVYVKETDNMVEIGGQRMTQAQFDAARYPLLQNVPPQAERTPWEKLEDAWADPFITEKLDKFEMTDSDLLAYTGMDAQRWAEKFCEKFDVFSKLERISVTDGYVTFRVSAANDEGLMTGWFANAIMAGYDRGRSDERQVGRGPM